MALLEQPAHRLLVPTPPMVVLPRASASHQRPHPQTLRGLKARATLAWGNAPGPRRTAPCGLKARAKPSIPHKLLVVLDPILHEHRSHLPLKIPLRMVRDLPIDIPHQRRSIPQSNRKHGIPSLPPEPCELRLLGLDPLRRRHLQSFDHARNRLVPAQQKRHGHMIGHPAHPHTHVLRSVQHCRQVRVQLRPHTLPNQGAPPLHTPHGMHQHKRERLRHPAHPTHTPRRATSPIRGLPCSTPS